MLIKLAHRYDSTAQLVDWLNPNDIGLDQYEMILEEKGPILCDFGTDPVSGRLTLYTPELIPLDTPMIYAPRNAKNQPLGRQDYIWQLQFPVPSMNVYKQITGWRYNLYESKR